MGKRVDLTINGDFHRGFAVYLKIRQENGKEIAGEKGNLPPYPELREHYNHWRALYRNLDEVLKTLPLKRNAITTNSSDALPACQKAADLLTDKFQQWLGSAEFSPIETTFRNGLSPEEDIWVLLETDNPQLLRFPWNLWGLRADFPKTEIGVASPSFRAVGNPSAPKDKVKILAILGDEIGSADVEALKRVSDCEVKWLVQPQPEDLDGPLWEEQWDMLFFAGHSWSLDDDRKGEIQLSRQVSLSISDLRNHLQKAIGQGLQLAIFNSCDGLGLAYQLAAGEDLHLPYTIVMRENLPKQVAPKWLDYFVQEFTRGKSLPGAVGEARKRLQSLEKDFPCASWLPVICQNQTAAPLTWETLRGMESGIKWREVCQQALAKQRRLTTNPLTAGDGLEFEVNDVYVPLGLMERKKQPKPQSDVSPERGSQLYQEKKAEEKEGEHEVTRIFRNDEFFEEVLGRGVSPKSGGRRLGIIGEPGSGKTTLLQKIADWVLKSSPQDVAIWVSLADLQSRSLEDYLLQKWLKDALGVARVTPEREDALVELFHSGRVWLLLDGVDEMSEANPLSVVNSQISGWVAKGRVVVSCRLNVWDAGKNYLEGFDVYRNLDFDPEQVGQFIGCWFARNPEKAAKLGAALEEAGKERIRDAVKNPLRLALLCQTWQQREASLPPTQALLYQQFAEVLYEWKDDRFPTTSQQQRELNGALGRLALKALDESSSRFRLRKQWVRECLGERDAPLCQLALQIGWLNIVGVAAENPSEEVYGFFHATFQEYFAALAVEDWHFFFNHVPDNPRKGTYRIFPPQWKQVILLWLGREDVAQQEKEEFIQALMAFEDGWQGFYETQAFFIAAAGIVEFDCSLANEIVAYLVKLGCGYLDNKKQYGVNSSIQEEAREALRETEVEIEIENLIKILDSSEVKYHFRREAANRLEEIAATVDDKEAIASAIAALVQLLHPSEDERILRVAARSLGYIARGNKEAIAALVQLLYCSENQGIIRVVASSLKEIAVGNKEAIAALVQLLHDSEDKNIVRVAVSILGEIDSGNKEAMAALIKRRDFSEDKDIVIVAVSSLVDLGLDKEKAIAALVQMLHDSKDKDIVRVAANSLGDIAQGNEQAIAALVQLLHDSEDKDIVRVAASNLEEISPGNKNAIAALMQRLHDSEDKDIVRVAASSLGDIAQGNEKAIAALVQLLHSSDDEYTRIYVAEILGEIAPGNREAIAALVQLLHSSDDEYTRRRAASSLGEIAPGNREAIAALVQLLHSSDDEDTRTRQQAAESLGEIALGNKEAIAALVKLLRHSSDDKDTRTRRRAAESLGKIAPVGNQEAIAALVKLLHSSDDEDTRKEAAESLGKIAPVGNQEAIAGLVQLLHDSDDEYTHKEAARSLGKIAPVGNQEAIVALVQLLHDSDDEYTRKQAKNVIKEILQGKSSFLDTVRGLKDCPYQDDYWHNVLWHCAQNLSYPDFHEAFNDRPIVPGASHFRTGEAFRYICRFVSSFVARMLAAAQPLR